MEEIAMSNKKVSYPERWANEYYHPLVEAETIYGNKVMIPNRYTNAWHTARTVYEAMKKQGLDHLDFLKNIKDIRFKVVVAVCFEVYEKNH